MKPKRLIAILLTALLLLPLGLFRLPESASADGAEDLWAQIEQYENVRLAEQGVSVKNASANDYMAMTDGVVALVEAHQSYAPGTLYCSGLSVFWHDTDGMGNGWVPNARQKQRANLTGADPMEVASVETVSYAGKGGYPYSSDVALIGPYYGVDSSFTNQYRNEANSIAQATGGSCTVYAGGAATIDAVAHALETCGTVIFDSHGNTDYSSASGDYTSEANTSYLCLTSNEGLTSQDTATVQGPFGSYQHAFRSGSGAFVDGTAIRNHMTVTAPNSFLWMAICLGMATDGMEAPLREQGVEAVYGYSQSVTFVGDYNWETYFWNKMKDGADIAEAVAYMKTMGGYKDPYESRYPAYPIVVSSEDPYPGQGNVDARQEVFSSWTLLPQFSVTAVPNDASLGTVETSGTTIIATPKTGSAVVGYEVISGKAAVRQNGDGLSRTLFSVRAQSDCTIRIDFARRTPVQVTFVTPAGVSCSAINGYVADVVTLPAPTGTPTANARPYAFYAWVDARVEDTNTRPDCLFAGDAFTLTEDHTFYALYFYAVQDGASVPAGTYQKLFAPPSDWAGKAVLTYDGEVVLSANTTASGVSSASGAVAIGSTGIRVIGDTLTDVPDNCLYKIESVETGVYTIRMTSGDGLYLCYNASSNKLSATNKVIVSGGKSAAYWTLGWEKDHPVIRSQQTTSATLCFDTEKQCFTCKKNNTGESLTVFTVPDCSLYYTTELENGSEPSPTASATATPTATPKPTATPTVKPTATPTAAPTTAPTPEAIDAKVEWNAEDVQFKGDTPYVIANGSAQTPRFTVINTADNSVIDSEYYDYAYAENTEAGTGYVLVTLKGRYTGNVRGWFKIYLPPTAQTAVENVRDGIRVTWTPVEGAAGYVIYRRAWSTTTNGWTAFSRWDNTTGTEYLDGHDASHKVYAGTRYQYGVKAYFAQRVDPVSGTLIGGNVGDNFNLGEVGPLKTTVRITTRELKTVTGGVNMLTVKWAPSKNFTGYQIQYATDEQFRRDVVAFKIEDPAAAETVIRNLSAGTTYYVRLRSYHVFNGMTYFGEWSNVLSAKTK